MTVPTRKEMDLILNWGELMEKFQWLREHPGTTRRDYQRALRDGSLLEWRIAKNKKSIASEQAAWEHDYPSIPYDNVTTCIAQHYPQELALFGAWQRGRSNSNGITDDT
jgi:hypothetical protein